MSKTNFKKDGNNVLVPIKALLENYADFNCSEYDEEDFNLLRRYFIACLNMAYIPESELKTYVNKFTFHIHSIVCCKNDGSLPIPVVQNNTSLIQWFRDGYTVFEQVLYINSDDRYTENHSQFEVLFFQAVTAVLINTTEDAPSLAIGLTQILADRLYNYDQTESRILLPRAEEFALGDRTLILRAGFTNNKLISNLTRQLLILMDVNELELSKALYEQGFRNCLKTIKSDVHNSILIHWMEELQQLIGAEMLCYQPDAEWRYIVKFEIDANEYFKNKNSADYFAFLALVPDKDLLKELRESENN